MVSGQENAYGLGSGILRLVRIWTDGRPSLIVQLWKRFRIFQRLSKRRAELLKNHNIMVPPLIILSATMKCNLDCVGCYSRDYDLSDEMSLDEIDTLFSQAVECGVGFFVITGGEPLLRKGLTDLLIKHHNLTFLLFNNGFFINDVWAKKVRKAGNIVPILSVEGYEKETDERRGKGVYKQVLKSMAHLKAANAFFGFSSMTYKHNMQVLSQDTFYDEMIKRGCRLGYVGTYVPVGSGADLSLLPTEEEQKAFRQVMLRFQKTKKLLLMHMPDDEYASGTCMAAARGFIHINAKGDVEPCPFSHVASHSIRESSLKKCLQSSFFSAIRNHNGLLSPPKRGCALAQRWETLMDIADKTGAKVTDQVEQYQS